MDANAPVPAAPSVAPRGAVLPPPVTRGARVGVAALSGPADPQRLADGLDALADLGFDPVPAANLSRRHGLFAGCDDERLAAFHELAADPSLGELSSHDSFYAVSVDAAGDLWLNTTLHGLGEAAIGMART